MRAVVLMRVAARSIDSSRFFGSFSMGSCIRERQSMGASPNSFRGGKHSEAAWCLVAIIHILPAYVNRTRVPVEDARQLLVLGGD